MRRILHQRSLVYRPIYSCYSVIVLLFSDDPFMLLSFLLCLYVLSVVVFCQLLTYETAAFQYMMSNTSLLSLLCFNF